jgi:hypothetical protein
LGGTGPRRDSVDGAVFVYDHAGGGDVHHDSDLPDDDAAVYHDHAAVYHDHDANDHDAFHDDHAGHHHDDDALHPHEPGSPRTRPVDAEPGPADVCARATDLHQWGGTRPAR